MGEAERDKVRLSDDLTPEQAERLKSAVRLMINYLLDNAPVERKNEIKKNDERVQATVLKAVQLRLEI